MKDSTVMKIFAVLVAAETLLVFLAVAHGSLPFVVISSFCCGVVWATWFSVWLNQIANKLEAAK